jgi:hypothetical protein
VRRLSKHTLDTAETRAIRHCRNCLARPRQQRRSLLMIELADGHLSQLALSLEYPQPRIRLSPTRSNWTIHLVTLDHLTTRFRTTVLIKLHLRLQASTEHESEGTVQDGPTVGGSRFNQTRGKDPSALELVRVGVLESRTFKST